MRDSQRGLRKRRRRRQGRQRDACEPNNSVRDCGSGRNETADRRPDWLPIDVPVNYGCSGANSEWLACVGSSTYDANRRDAELVYPFHARKH